jgi:hypothetical protein
MTSLDASPWRHRQGAYRVGTAGPEVCTGWAGFGRKGLPDKGVPT